MDPWCWICGFGLHEPMVVASLMQLFAIINKNHLHNTKQWKRSDTVELCNLLQYNIM